MRSGDGIQYYEQSNISNGAGYTSAAGALISTESGNAAPANYEGIDARAFHQNGALCEQSGYLFNPAGAVGVSQVVNYLGNSCGAGYYYSQGIAAVWTGSNYSYERTGDTNLLYAPWPPRCHPDRK